MHAVLQLAYVSEREGGGTKAMEASAAAHNMLMALGTDPAHGMLPRSGSAGHQGGHMGVFDDGVQGQDKQQTTNSSGMA